jgi:hypothetical protein
VAIGVAEDAVIANFDESWGKNVLEEAANELLRVESAALELRGSAIFVREGDPAIFKLEDAIVANGDTKYIGSEILEGMLAGANGLGVDDPFFVPDLGIDLSKEIGLLEKITEFGAKEDGEGVAMDEEVWFRG